MRRRARQRWLSVDRQIFKHNMFEYIHGSRIGKERAYAMKRVAAGLIARILGFLSLRNAQTIKPNSAWAAFSSTSVLTPGTRFYSWLDWNGVPAETVGEKWWGLGPVSVPSKLGHLGMPIDLPGKTSCLERGSNPGPWGLQSNARPLRHTDSTSRLRMSEISDCDFHSNLKNVRL